jgi:hypothetical protein
MTTPFRIHALPADVLARVRSMPAGPSLIRLRAEGDEPLRCCLRNARGGESLLLFNYEPPIGEHSPYRELGAVFAHAERCDGPPPPDAYPPAWRGRRQVLRAYDRRGWIRDAVVHDGARPEEEIARLLDDPEVVQLHSRNVAYGCFMFAITRD